MNIDQIRFFCVTAEELHFARAAEHLGITQSGLSKSIQKLENELGFKLFSTSNKWDVHLTVSGKSYYQEMSRILRDIENAKEQALSAGRGESGRLVIGAISSMIGQASFIDSMAYMRKHFPNVVLELIDSTSGELSVLLREHRVDLAFLRLEEHFSDEKFIVRKMYDDRLLLAISRKHPLAGRKEIQIADLRNDNFILVPERVSWVFRNYVLDLCRSKGGFTPKVIQEVDNNYTVLRLTAAGCGVSIVSSAYAGIFGDRLLYRTVSDFQPELPMYAVYPAEKELPLAKRFLNIFAGVHKSVQSIKIQ